MRKNHFKTIALTTLVLSFCSINTYAAETAADVFKKSCVAEWMKHADKSADKVGFQNFGEKFCDCAKEKSVDTDEAVKVSARSCVAETILQDTMDGLENNPGLSKVNSDKIITACEDEWNLIYPQMDADVKKATSNFCQCASPQLAEMSKNQDDYTDDQWDAKVATISTSCADKIGLNKSEAMNTIKFLNQVVKRS